MLRFLTAGESHGQTLVMTLDGMPAGLQLDVDALNSESESKACRGEAAETNADSEVAQLNQVVTTALGLVDGADAASVPSVDEAITAAMALRDEAIAYIHSIAPPPVADEGRVQADASGAEVGTGFDALMPGYAPLLDDEIQQATVARLMAPSSPVGLGKDRDDWPSDVIRRAAGVAARSLNGTESVITTLSVVTLGSRRLDQPEPCELDGKLRA